MSSFEQRKESTDRKYQYLLFNASPYEVPPLVSRLTPHQSVMHTTFKQNHFLFEPDTQAGDVALVNWLVIDAGCLVLDRI